MHNAPLPKAQLTLSQHHTHSTTDYKLQVLRWKLHEEESVRPVFPAAPAAYTTSPPPAPAPSPVCV